ncbi:hypothetical protein OBRU01_26165, partial [Operophtera brumata]
MLEALENGTPICFTLVSQKEHPDTHNLNNEGLPLLPATPARLTTMNLEPSNYEENFTVHHANSSQVSSLLHVYQYKITIECTVLSGRRIIDIQTFFDKLKAVAGHKSLFNCGLSSIQIVSERKIGLYSRLNLHCMMCKQTFHIVTTDHNINKDAVAGILASVAAVDLPEISQNYYQKVQNQVADEWESTAWVEMIKAAEIEREATLNEGRVNKDGIAMIDVIVDGCWCKRSYQTNYAANSGCAAIIGRRTARKYICDAIRLNKADKNCENLHNDINNSVCHAFGKHSKCKKDICSHTDEIVTQFDASSLWQRIRILAANVASHSRSLIEDVDSNVVEQFNGVIAKLVGGKRINYSQRRSYQTRCAGAVISFNTGKLLSTVHRNIIKKSPRKSLKKYDSQFCRKREINKLTIRKKKRQYTANQPADTNYGENSDQPDMDPETFEMAKKTFLANLQKTEEELLQSECGEWLELRRNLLTASNFGKVIKRRKTHSCRNIVKNMLYGTSIDHVSSVQHGRQHEAVALEKLSKLNNIRIRKCGLFIDETFPYVKCPIAPFKLKNIDAAIDEKKVHFWKKNNGQSDWYYQAQGQMHIAKKTKCLFAVWYGENQLKVEILQKDDEFWRKEMEPKLVSFYMDCLLPDLVDPRHPKKKMIRDPAYVTVIKRKFQEEDASDATNASEFVPPQKQTTIARGNGVVTAAAGPGHLTAAATRQGHFTADAALKLSPSNSIAIFLY